MQWRDEVEKKMPRRSRGNVSPSSQDGPGRIGLLGLGGLGCQAGELVSAQLLNLGGK